MPPRILGGQSKKIEKSNKFSQKSETFGHQLPTCATTKIDQSNPKICI
jgi:hypothetical protein